MHCQAFKWRIYGNFTVFSPFLGIVFIFSPRNAQRRQDFSCRQFVVGLPHREAVKPPLLVPVFRDRLLDVWELFVR